MTFRDELIALVARYSIEDVESGLENFKHTLREAKIAERELLSVRRACSVYKAVTVEHKSFKEISSKLGVTAERVRQIYAKHQRRLRHPSRRKQTTMPRTDGCDCIDIEISQENE